MTAEIAAIRGVPSPASDCISPRGHSAFSHAARADAASSPDCASSSGGKPVGFKLCIGHPWEFLAVCKAMLETGITPDFIVVDGKEGGTGAAPLEFTDHLGMPMREGLLFVHNALIGISARERIRIGAPGKIVTAFDMARAMALGADWCNAARGFMFALGCIQSHELPHRRLPDRRRHPGPDALSARSSSRTRPSGCGTTTPRCCMRSPSSPPRPGSTIHETSGRSISRGGSARPSR